MTTPKPDLIQLTSQTGKRYWRSLGELADTKSFRDWVHREFPEGASEMLDIASRRTLLKLMGASFGLAGLTACRRPEHNILPMSKGIEGYIPGKASYYSTAFSHAGAVTGLIVETHDGRPTKIEGNPDHPFSLGAANAFAQASILDLYDPDRSTDVLQDGKKATWDAWTAAAKDAAGKIGQGDGVRFLSERVTSPSLEAVRAAALLKCPKAKWVEFDPINDDQSLTATQIAFGEPMEAQYDFSKADVIVSLDSDFLGLDTSTVLPIKQFSKRRRVAGEEDSMNRLYMVESQYSITGAMADHRKRMRTADVPEFASQLWNAVSGLNVVGGDKWLNALAKELKAAKGKCIVIAGPRQDVHTHLIALQLNELLGNLGETVSFYKTGRKPCVPALRELASEMSAGQVSTLVMLGGNPVFNAPADLQFEANLKKVPVSIHLGSHADETALACKWHVPQAHYLESWSDGRAPDGTATVQQPMIEPLYGGKTPAELAALLTGYKDLKSHDIVKNSWKLPESEWKQALNDGLVAKTKVEPVAKLALNKTAVSAHPKPAAANGIEVVFVPSWSVYDGRFANNGWLQEAPDPITKVVWNNAALMSAATAQTLGVHGPVENVQIADVISLKYGGQTVEAAVQVQPGHADNSITLAVGYGRKHCGRVGTDVGTNVYPIRTTSGLNCVTGVEISKAARTEKLVSTQEHFAMEGRPIVREASLAEYRRNPKFVEGGEEPEDLTSLYGDRVYDTGNQWAMSIDLSSCIGCNACLVACVSENNIPIVGKAQVSRGREMHWIRMDRYYVGDINEPQVVTQPLPCMQCENAPCENVCPVAATVHSPEGLNEMAYNRCVGTRYCANNCPYKVRRFNFLNWHLNDEKVHNLVFNPDVTVRMRGVMEKCNYCVQRIQEARITAKTDGRREIKDGEVLTACQQTCPADAIVFGNKNDPNSRVSKLKKQERDYALLAELEVRPRTTYLAKLRNPNPELA
jgi:MoCo/4Fe-4S cofactor protein with predicted Tat translocation signal